jgi:hypothetical protein
MNKKKHFDCVEFKHKLHRAAFKKSGAKTLKEYVRHVNSEAAKSPLYRVAVR